MNLLFLIAIEQKVL